MARIILHQTNDLFAEYSTILGFTAVNLSKNQIVRHIDNHNPTWAREIESILDSPENSGIFKMPLC
jgi:hypothetical protein